MTADVSLLPARPAEAREALHDHCAALRKVGTALAQVDAAAFWRAACARGACGYGYNDIAAGLLLAAGGAVDAAGTETGR